MDIKRYRRLQAEGCADVYRDANGKHFLRFKRFNPENGQELDPELQELFLDRLHIYRDEMSANYEAANAVINQINRAD